MMRSRPPSPGGTRRPFRRRVASWATLACLVALAALAAGALFTPTFVFGSQAGSPHPGPEVVVESSLPAGPGNTAGTTTPAAPTGGASAASAASAPSAGASPVSAAAANLGDLVPSTGDLLVTLPWGSEDGEVGLVQPVEGLVRGPDALAVAPDGRIVVLDSVNCRLVLLNSTGAVTGTVAIPLAEPRFLAVTNERMYVLDCDSDHRLLTLYWSGLQCASAMLPDLPDAVTGLFATSSGPCVEVAHQKVYRISKRAPGRNLGDISDSDGSLLQSGDLTLASISGRPAGSELTRMVSARFAPNTAPLLTSYVTGSTGLVTQSSALQMPVPAGRSIEHLLSLDGDLSQRLVVGARLLDDPDQTAPAALLLTRFMLGPDGSISPATTPDGTSDSLLLLDTSFAYVGQPYTVAPDGRVFQPVATESGYAIFVHTFPGVDPSAQSTGVQP